VQGNTKQGDKTELATKRKAGHEGEGGKAASSDEWKQRQGAKAEGVEAGRRGPWRT